VLLIELQLVKTFFAFFGTQRYIALSQEGPVVLPTLCKHFLSSYAMETAIPYIKHLHGDLLPCMSLDMDTNFIYLTAS
jgi:hypothetical protein